MGSIPKKILNPALRIFLGIIFLAAGTAKWMHPSDFFDDLLHYELLPNSINLILAWQIPCLEILLGFCLLTRVWLPETIMLSLTLLCSFTLALASAWMRGLDINCGCFGPSMDFGSYPFWIGRNLLLMAGLVHLLVDQSFFIKNQSR